MTNGGRYLQNVLYDVGPIYRDNFVAWEVSEAAEGKITYTCFHLDSSIGYMDVSVFDIISCVARRGGIDVNILPQAYRLETVRMLTVAKTPKVKC